MDDLDASSLICITDISTTVTVANYSRIAEFAFPIIYDALSFQLEYCLTLEDKTKRVLYQVPQSWRIQQVATLIQESQRLSKFCPHLMSLISPKVFEDPVVLYVNRRQRRLHWHTYPSLLNRIVYYQPSPIIQAQSIQPTIVVEQWA